MPTGVYQHKSIPKEQREKISFALSGEKSYMWVGDKVGYQGVHGWIRKTLGKPSKCEDCGTESVKRYEWANISGLYLRKVSDWKRLCKKCHAKFDNISIRLSNKKKGIPLSEQHKISLRKPHKKAKLTSGERKLISAKAIETKIKKYGEDWARQSLLKGKQKRNYKEILLKSWATRRSKQSL